jgi:hypothetical protein
MSRPSVTPAPTRRGLAASAAIRAGAGAVHFVGSLPRPTLRPESDQVSTAVLLTLLAVLLAVLLGVGSTYVPALRARAWR